MQIKNLLKIILTLSFLLATYVAGNLYIYSSLCSVFPTINPFYLQLAIIILGLLYPLTELLRRFLSIDPISFIGTTYLGFVSITSTILLLRALLNFLVPLPAYSLKYAIYISVILSLHALIRNYLPHKVKHITITSKKISRPSRIVFISDLHLCYLKSRKWLSNLVSRINDEDPDLIIIGGDLLDCKMERASKYIPIMEKIRAPIIAVPGNHDYYSGIKEVERFYNEIGATLLENRCVEEGDAIVCGVADIMAKYLGINEPDPENTLCKTSADKFRIFIHHSPLLYREAASCGADLMLSGHTHAGQIPPMEMIVFLYYYNPWGMKKWQNMLFYTSAGAGTWGPPMRFLSRNEIVVIELKNA